MSFHHERKFGCHASSARWSRLSLDRSTLFGIFVSLTTVDIVLLPQVRFQLNSGRSGLP